MTRRPPFLVSACLIGQACRYDGAAAAHPAAMRWLAEGRALPVCPEMLGGLPCPRPPCELRGDRAIDARGNDHTRAFLTGCAEALKQARQAGCRLALLKARSPSCGIGGIYDGSFSRRLIKADGLFVRAARAAGLVVLSDEDIA